MHWWRHVDILKWLIAIVLCIASACATAQDSPLSTGDWYKLSVLNTGIYKIDAAQFRKMGVDIEGMDPRNIQIYGNGGQMLPQPIVSGYETSLKENSIWVHGEHDGTFDSGDFVLFYAEGPHVVTYDSVKSELLHQINCYSDTAFYFLTIGQRAGKRIAQAPLVNAVNAPVITYFDDYWFHEKEATNLLKSGREWWGEYLSGSIPLTFDIELPGIVAGSDIKMRTSAIGAAQQPTRFIWHLNGKTVGEGTLGTVSTGTYDVKALRLDATYSASVQSSDNEVFKAGITYDKQGQSGALGYLNFIGLQTRRAFRSYDQQQTYFCLPQKTDTVTYEFKNEIAGFNLWDITDVRNPSVVFQNATVSQTFALRQGKKLVKFLGFSVDKLYNVHSWRKIPNQNIVSFETPELLIVTPTAWESEARRLASLREDHDKIQTEVVTTSQIYNEYGSGRPDITAIRNFVTSLYKKNPDKLKYLLLFGDATYDHKNLLFNQTQAQRNNWVPVYESRESLNPVYTYSSDDYFGFTEDSEGAWAENLAGDHTLEIGIGRLPVKTISEARTVVDKLIRYESPKSNGNWRNVVKFVADDGDGNIHQRHADQLAGMVEKNFMSSRLFIDEKPKSSTPQGLKAPALNAAILDAIKDGTLILNYTGHGGVSGWAEEQVLTISDMQAARGINNLPLLFTATCDFGRYDDPGIVSGAELMVLSPKGAAAGAISTTRPVYSSTNFTLSKAFYEALVAEGPEKRMGDLFRETKNNALVGSLNRNFALLGDPSMKLVDRQKQIRWSQQPDTLKARQKIILKGEVTDGSSEGIDEDFNGFARVVIYDKKSAFKTLGSNGNPETYSEFRNKLFDGTVTVNKGRFMVALVPGEVSAGIGTGRGNVYAFNHDSTSYASSQLDLMVGGKGMGQADNVPPKVVAYLNSETFKNGDTVEPSPVFYAKLSDESGINISDAGEGGHITLTLNDTLVIVLSNYYVALLDDPFSGVVTYPFENLPAGSYTARLKVWDTHTNVSEFTFGFLVGGASSIRFNDFKIYPNPFSDLLSFELSHNRVNEDIEIVFNIFLQNGQRLGTLKRQYYNTAEHIRETLASDELGNWVPKNVMLLYQLNLRSLKDNTIDQRSGQLIRTP